MFLLGTWNLRAESSESDSEFLSLLFVSFSYVCIKNDDSTAVKILLTDLKYSYLSCLQKLTVLSLMPYGHKSFIIEKCFQFPVLIYLNSV